MSDKDKIWEMKNKSDIKKNGYIEYNSDGDFFQIVLTKYPVYYESIGHFIESSIFTKSFSVVIIYSTSKDLAILNIF